MSKPVKQMIVAEYQQRFDGIDDALVIDIRGIEANDNNEFRLGLFKKDIRVTVIKNTLAKKAFEGTGLEGLAPALDGPSAIAYGAESVVDVAREVLAWAKKIKNLDLKGAVLDGQYFDGQAGVQALGDFPTRPEALAQAVQIILTPGGELVGCATGPGASLLAIVETLIDKLEK